MIRRVVYMMVCVWMCSCASKQMQTSLKNLEAENKTLRGDVAKLQTQVQTLTNDVLIVQNRVEHQPTLPLIRTAAPVVEAKPVAEAPKKMYRQESFLGDDIQFTDDEPSVNAAGSLKFTNKHLSNLPPLQITPGSGSKPEATTPAKSKSGNFTEQTLIEDPSKREVKADSKSTVEDPAIVASYNRAYKTFQEQNFRDTVRLMDEFLKQYPSHQYSDNATFWMGESYYQLKNYEQAHAEFEKVVTKYPNGNKVPDALLRSGICMLKLSKPDKAKSTFNQLIKKYPESVAAKKAKASLGEL